MIAGIILTASGCFILWWRARSLSYPIVLRPSIFRFPLLPIITMLFGVAFLVFGLYVISQQNSIVALVSAVILGLHQAFSAFRNTIRARIDRVFRCYNEIRLVNIVRQNRNQPLFDDPEMLREAAALYAKRQGWPRLKIDSFRVSFIDTEGAARSTNIKDLAYALLVFEAREERMDEWSDRHFAIEGRNWTYLNERYERFNNAASKRNGAA